MERKRKGKKEEQEKAWEMTHKFVKELSTFLDIELIYAVTGSLGKGNYIHGKSDIDIMIIPDKQPKKGELPPSAFLWMVEQGKKYGTVFKKGRDIGLFDVSIFMNSKQQKVVRAELKKLKDIKDKYHIYNTKDEEDERIQESPLTTS